VIPEGGGEIIERARPREATEVRADLAADTVHRMALDAALGAEDPRARERVLGRTEEGLSPRHARAGHEREGDGDARHPGDRTAQYSPLPGPLLRPLQRSEIRDEVRHLLAAKRRPRRRLALELGLGDEGMVPQRRQRAGRSVDPGRRIEVARDFSALAVEPVAAEAPLVGGHDHAVARVARLL